MHHNITPSTFSEKDCKNPKRVCVIGLGRVGLPIACVLATSGHAVLGVDTDCEVVRGIKLANLTNLEKNVQELLTRAIQSNNLVVSTKVSPANVYIIAVPTLLGPRNQPDISYVDKAIDAIQPQLQFNDLVLIESTCPIGTTESIAKKLRTTCSDIYVAYCPERILPGNTIYELVNNSRVIGGVDEASTSHAAYFYQTFICGDIVTTNVRTAEAVKLVENSYRDVNIAFANEISMIADRINLDINELIRLANKHPRVNILNPGPGVGGNCIAIDPWFFVSAAPDLAVLTSQARDVNLNKTQWVIQKIKNTIKENNVRKVTCLGLTYKPNIPDTSASPALAVVLALEKELEVLRVDPYVTDTKLLYEAIASAELIVCLVAHREFKKIPLNFIANKIILDFTGIFT